MHVFCSKSTHVESDALNCNNRILAPKNLTEPKNIDNHKFGLFLFLLTIPRGLRPRGPPLHIQGHSSPDDWAAIICSLDVQIGHNLVKQLNSKGLGCYIVCQQIGIQ